MVHSVNFQGIGGHAPRFDHPVVNFNRCALMEERHLQHQGGLVLIAEHRAAQTSEWPGNHVYWHAWRQLHGRMHRQAAVHDGVDSLEILEKLALIRRRQNFDNQVRFESRDAIAFLAEQE